MNPRTGGPPGPKLSHKFCLTHGWGTSQFPGEWGRRCALGRWNFRAKRYDCRTVPRAGVLERLRNPEIEKYIPTRVRPS